MAAEGWTRDDLRARCTQLRDALTAAGTVPTDRIAAYWPGGAENPNRGMGGWIYCYASLGRLHGEDAVRRELAGGARGEQDLLAALAAEPVAVTLPEGTTFQCHPKSYLALRWLAHADALLGAMLHQIERIPYFQADEQESLREEAMLGTTEMQLALVWAAVHPGPGLPFDERQRIPTIPPEIQAISPIGIYQVLQAYRTANLQGLAALPALTDGAVDGRRPTFAMFFASMAQESGLSADALMRERPLVQLLAQARLSALSREPAKAVA